ncbi:unnamed protein product [Boreogadus saida]
MPRGAEKGLQGYQMNSSIGENVTTVDWQVAMVTGYLINVMVAFPTNCYVLFLILSHPNKDLSTEFFTLNLSTLEILNCLSDFVNLISLYVHVTAAKLLRDLSFGMVHTTRLLFQCCICVEVYLGVVRPVTFLQVKGLKYRVGMSAVVWITGLCTSILFYLCNHWVGLPYVYLTEYLMLLSLKLFCCSSVIRTLRKPRPGEATAAAKSTQRKDIRRRAWHTVSIILTSITLNYSINIILALSAYFLSYDALHILYIMSSFVGIANGVVLPLIYASKVGRWTVGKDCLVNCLALGSGR